MTDQFEKTIQANALVRQNDRILVAVSGGPDSMALLLKLRGLSKKLNLTLHIAHLDHAWRPNSSADACFVRRWATRLKIPLTVKRLAYKMPKIEGSVEEFLRNQRLNFLAQTAKAIKANKIALGHNLDDQAETVLMRLLRGSGLSGLSGIHLKRKMLGVTFIRPLLEVPRSQIEAFLKSQGVSPRRDYTNRQDIFLRNRIRRRLMPLLKKYYNPNMAQVLANLAETTAQDYEYLEQETKRSFKTSRRLTLKKLAQLHPAILRLKLRQGIACAQGDTRRITFQHMKELQALIFSRPVGSVVNLPKGLSAKKTSRAILFFKR